VLGNEKTVAAIVLQGITGTLTVKGSPYNGAMPAFKAQLGDAQIAAVLSHVRSQWGNGAAAVAAETVAGVREQHKARAGPFAGDPDLAALK
jgi:mono/diheme cytochrome c family protein